MKQIVKVRNITIGDTTKICVSITDNNIEDIIKSFNDFQKLPIDIIEWRFDYFLYSFTENIDTILDDINFILSDIKKINNKPIIFTLRSKDEGGDFLLNKDNYRYLILFYKIIIERQYFDIIDFEFFNIKYKDLKSLVSLSQYNNIKTIFSNHNFNKTPREKEIISIIKKMISLNCDIVKIAYMAKTKKDVINVLNASYRFSDNIPIIAISMGQLGSITRIFSCDISFAKLENSLSNNLGQIDVIKLKFILDSI